MINTPAVPVTLEQMLARDEELPVVAHLNARLIVVLGRSGNNEIEVWGEDLISLCSPATAVEVVTDQDLIERVLGQAVVNVNQERLNAVQELHSAQDQQTATLDRIRTYAIRRHEHGVICRDGLDGFLEAFDLAAYDPRSVVSFTLQGCYQVQADSAHAARQSATESVEVQASNICGYSYGSLEFEVTATNATMLAGHSQTQAMVNYTVTGTCVSYNTDTDHVRGDAIAHLAVDVSRVPGLIAGTDVSELHAGSVAVEQQV